MNETTRNSIDVLAEIIDLVVWLLKDKPLSVALLTGNRVEAIKLLVKNHKEESIELITRTKGISLEEYSSDPFGIFSDLMDILQDKRINDFFTSWRKQMKTSSGSATTNTEEKKNTSSNGSKQKSKQKTKND